jgi:diaminohydroxyphosphoribosylaminopyrimidine deaminase/5-amino-6-(5-phosphoribosylamino)uracil reductase
VVTTRGELPAAAWVLRTPPPTLVLAPAVDAATAARLGEGGAEVVAYGDGGLAAALRALGERGLLDVLCEGGPTLAAALLAEGLVDRVTVFVAPLLVGRGAPDLLAAPAVARLADGLRLREVEWRQVGDDLMVSGWLGDGAAWPIREEDRCSRAS